MYLYIADCISAFNESPLCKTGNIAVIRELNQLCLIFSYFSVPRFSVIEQAILIGKEK